MRIRRRRNEQQPVVLPSLDRLSGLIERVVELVDAVGDSKTTPAPEPVVEAPREPSAAEEARPSQDTVAASGWLAFVGTAHGYRLVDVPGLTPRPGEPVELEGRPWRVLKVARSPLPGDSRRCAYLEGEEPREEDRKGDA
jgi:hypothetical protein